MKKLVTLISTEGKTATQIHQELTSNLKTFKDTQAKLSHKEVKSTIFFNQHRASKTQVHLP